MPPKLTEEDVINKIKNIDNNNYELISNYEGTSKPFILKHKICGEEYRVSKGNIFLNEGKGRCPKCFKNEGNKKARNYKNISDKDFFEEIKKENKDYTYIEGFNKNGSDKVLLRHEICGNEYKVEPRLFLGNKKRRCPFCSNKKRGKYYYKDDENYLIKILSESKDGNEYEWLDLNYKFNNKEKYPIKHKKCGNIYSVRVNDFQQGYRCPLCKNIKSNQEIELIKYIKESYKGIILNNKRFSFNDQIYEVDLFFPDKKIGFEFNGYYYHSDKMKNKEYHKHKKDFFKNNFDIEIYFINSLDYEFKKDLIINRILYSIDYFQEKKINARECNFEIINDYDAKNFYKNNSTYINSSHDINFSLKINDEIIAIMSYNYINKNKVKLEKFAFSNKTIVNGGLFKLLSNSIKYFKRNNIKTIDLIINKDYSDGKYFKDFGFNYVKELKSTCKIIFKRNIYSVHEFEKSIIPEYFPNYINENMEYSDFPKKQSGVYRIWNSGNILMNYKIY
ncbi:homing endonuclease [Staphylococcus phage vB_StaM_PB50]|nr:homing endonuclease [Staphylococcus phage vB_StaM_PB50]